ncbi:MAG: CAP domain-containing protein [Anaerolineae bacterium]|nr:CAP domain-containing protein [Anaerolineae bacterium]
MTFNISSVRERELQRRRQQRQRRVKIVLAVIVLLVLVGGITAVGLFIFNESRESDQHPTVSSAVVVDQVTSTMTPSNFAELNALRLTQTAQFVRPSRTPGVSPTSVFAADHTQETEIVRLVNEARTAAGLQEVQINPVLTSVAQGHSNDMAQNSFLDHAGSDGSRPADRVQAAGYDFRAVGENVLYQFQIDSNQAFTSWWNSQGHRENMMNPLFTEIGVAYTSGSDGRIYYTMVLGLPLS